MDSSFKESGDHSTPVAFYLCDLVPFLFQAPMKNPCHNISEGDTVATLLLVSCCAADILVPYNETIFEDCGAFTNLLILHREEEKF